MVDRRKPARVEISERVTLKAHSTTTASTKVSNILMTFQVKHI
jgi:hypothetical protein